jgi:hypothetical protein
MSIAPTTAAPLPVNCARKPDAAQFLERRVMLDKRL